MSPDPFEPPKKGDESHAVGELGPGVKIAVWVQLPQSREKCRDERRTDHRYGLGHNRGRRTDDDTGATADAAAARVHPPVGGVVEFLTKSVELTYRLAYDRISEERAKWEN